MKRTMKVVGIIAGGFGLLLLWLSSDDRQATVLGYLAVAGCVIWAIIDHVNTRVKYLRTEIANLQRQIDDLKEDQDLSLMPIFTTRDAPD